MRDTYIRKPIFFSLNPPLKYFTFVELIMWAPPESIGHVLL